MGPARQGVHFPVFKTFTALHNGWTLLNTAAIGQFSAPIIGSVAFAALLLATQMFIEIAARLFVG
jgi:hypothetical protein